MLTFRQQTPWCHLPKPLPTAHSPLAFLAFALPKTPRGSNPPPPLRPLPSGHCPTRALQKTGGPGTSNCSDAHLTCGRLLRMSISTKKQRRRQDASKTKQTTCAGSGEKYEQRADQRAATSPPQPPQDRQATALHKKPFQFCVMILLYKAPLLRQRAPCFTHPPANALTRTGDNTRYEFHSLSER